jgi:hypothetical protein
MGSPSFGLTGNNAPPPPSGGWNPTGTNTGVGYNSSGSGSYPLYGAPSSSPVSPSANAPLWSGTSGGLADLSSGFNLGTNWGSFDNLLGKSYGKGTGQLLYNIFDQGMFNPQVASAFLNAMGPGNAQGLASVQDSFGNEGARFGSEAALGIGNYESQVNLNEQSTLASMYENAQSEQLSLLSQVLPTLHQETADSGFMADLGDASTFLATLTNAGTPFTASTAPSIPGSTPQGSSTGTSSGAPISSSSPSGTAGTTVGSDYGTMNAPALDSYSEETSASAALGGSSGIAGAGASSTGALGELGALFA